MTDIRSFEGSYEARFGDYVQLLKPRVMSLTSSNLKMGELSAAKTQFQLRANPRVNQIQAALFTDKKQQINSPMFRKKPNPAIYNEQAVKSGAQYLPDGVGSQTFNLLSSKMSRRNKD